MRRRESGSMLLIIVFFMVVGGALAAGVLAATRSQSQTSALDVQGVRAYWAARSALEWAAYQVSDPDNTQGLGASQLPACFASPKALALPGDLGAFTVSVSCARQPAVGSHEEQQNRIVGYVLTATASSGGAAAPDRIERQVQTTVIRCKNPVAGSAPDYPCQ